MPFLQDSVDDEDEVLLALAEELGRNLKEYIRGKGMCICYWVLLKSCWLWKRPLYEIRCV